jgi:hypothetical protein
MQKPVKHPPGLIMPTIANNISTDIWKNLQLKYDEIGKMLGSMANNPQKFLPSHAG